MTTEDYRIVLSNSAGELDSRTVTIDPDKGGAPIKHAILDLVSECADFFDGDTITVRLIKS